MPTPAELSPAQLREAIKLSEQIDSLRQRLHGILGGPGQARTASTAKKAAKAFKPGRRTMSPAARAKIAAGARARWAKVRGTKAKPSVAVKPATAPKKKGGLTPEGRAKLAAAMKARWAARKKGAPAPNASA